MTLEQSQPARDQESSEALELLENRGEQFENMHEGALDASLFLTAFALALNRAKEFTQKTATGVGFAAALAGCGDFSSVSSPESQTNIITVSQEVEKKFEQGEIRFNRCAPSAEQYEGKNIQITQRTLIVEDANRKSDDGVPSYFGARFMFVDFEGSDQTQVFAKFFADDERAYAEPCEIHRIEGPKLEQDRYLMLVENLNLRLNAYKALRQTAGTDIEQQATLGQIAEFVEKLDKEFSQAYDRKLVQEITTTYN